MSSAVTTHVPDLQNYVGGAWHHSATKEYLDFANPAQRRFLRGLRFPRMRTSTRRCKLLLRPSRRGGALLLASAFSIFSSSRICSRSTLRNCLG